MLPYTVKAYNQQGDCLHITHTKSLAYAKRAGNNAFKYHMERVDIFLYSRLFLWRCQNHDRWQLVNSKRF